MSGVLRCIISRGQHRDGRCLVLASAWIFFCGPGSSDSGWLDFARILRFRAKNSRSEPVAERRATRNNNGYCAEAGAQTVAHNMRTAVRAHNSMAGVIPPKKRAGLVGALLESAGKAVVGAATAPCALFSRNVFCRNGGLSRSYGRLLEKNSSSDETQSSAKGGGWHPESSQIITPPEIFIPAPLSVLRRSLAPSAVGHRSYCCVLSKVCDALSGSVSKQSRALSTAENPLSDLEILSLGPSDGVVVTGSALMAWGRAASLLKTIVQVTKMRQYSGASVETGIWGMVPHY